MVAVAVGLELMLVDGQAFHDSEMALFAKQASEVDIIISTALIRESSRPAIDSVLQNSSPHELTDGESWETCSEINLEGTC